MMNGLKMLDPVKVYHIAGLLTHTKFTDFSGSPIEVVRQFESLVTGNNVTTIAQAIHVPEEDLELFVNETQPCLRNITMNAIQKNTINDTQTIVDSFWNKW